VNMPMYKICIVCLVGMPVGNFARGVNVRNPFSWEVIQLASTASKKQEKFPYELRGIASGVKGRYALLNSGKGMVMVRQHDGLLRGWKVEAITQSTIVLCHRDGSKRELKL
jgi:hypothetical protein